MSANVSVDGKVARLTRAEALGTELMVENLSFSYGNGMVLSELTLTMQMGEMVAVLGPNGSGKTTLLRLVSGALNPQSGGVSIGGQPLDRLRRGEVARFMAVLPQEVSVPYALRAREIVALGRTPYARPFSGERERDRDAVAKAMEDTDTSHLADGIFNDLSGGERQRVLLAMALAQEPRLLLLDEPTVHLDIKYQMEALELVRRLNLEKGIGVLAVMHDLNLAASYFDRLILLRGGRLVADGTPRDVLTSALVRTAFGAEAIVLSHPTSGVPHVVVVPKGGIAASPLGPGS